MNTPLSPLAEQAEVLRAKFEIRKIMDQHDWRKTDLFSGFKTNYECESCGVKGVRNGFEWPPQIIPYAKARKKAYRVCPPDPELDKEVPLLDRLIELLDQNLAD